MGKAALFAITAFTLMGAYYTLGSQRSMVGSVDRLGGHQYEVVARNAAVTGYMQVRQGVADAGNFSVGTVQGTFEGASYQSSVDWGGGTRATIKSRGWVTDSQNQTHEFHIRAEVEREMVAEVQEEPPLFMRYALLADGDIELKGNAGTDVYEVVQGQEHNELNASIHANGKISTNGNVNVRGFGTHVNGSSARTSKHFNPYHNPTNADVLQQVDEPVEVPSFSSADFLSRVQTYETYTGGNLSISGNTSFGGTREDPRVIYVPGNLKLSGQVSGYVMFIVEGHLDITGGVRIGSNSFDGPDESSLAMYVGGDLKMRGNAEVYGQIYVAGEISSQGGTADVYGNIVSAGNGQLRGTPRIYYRRASPALTTIFEEAKPRLKMISYSEW